jgi:Mn2+/Fe2+ NRAMP family transporter
VKKLLEIALGILTAVGGFVDIGDIVANSEAGARFGMSLAWVVVLGVLGILVYAEMAGRVATVSGRPVFDLVRERLGARAALVNLLASSLVNLLTLAAEIGGAALALQLASGASYLLWLPPVALLLWLVIWRMPFSLLENLFGLLGLALVVTVVALWRQHPDWSSVWHAAAHPAVPPGEGHPSYWFFAIALLGSAMTPYEVFFFSSGAVEEGWSRQDLIVNRANVYIGFPLGGLLALALMTGSALLLEPHGIQTSHLSQVALPVALSVGRVGLAVLLLGLFAATFGAALETGLSSGYTIAQYFGWQWGKYVRPREAARFHLVVLAAIVLGLLLLLTTVDPIKVTEYSLVLSAAALPLTYFPILVVANDPGYMGEKVNSKLSNAIATVFLLLLAAVTVTAIPLMILTKAGS